MNLLYMCLRESIQWLESWSWTGRNLVHSAHLPTLLLELQLYRPSYHHLPSIRTELLSQDRVLTLCSKALDISEYLVARRIRVEGRNSLVRY